MEQKQVVSHSRHFRVDVAGKQGREIVRAFARSRNMFTKDMIHMLEASLWLC